MAPPRLLGSWRLPGVAWLVPPWIVGAVLRVWGLRHQVVIGDETHGLAVAVGTPLRKILTTYRMADPCIPLTALYRVLGDVGVGLSETVIRLPSVAAGIAVLVILPWLVVRWEAGRMGWTWAATCAWLLALSPNLVYYSRIARPYAVIVLLAPLAALAFWRWWQGGRTAWAAVYVLAGAASAWFHLATVPFVVAPLGFGAVDLVARRRRRPPRPGRSFLELCAVGGALAAGFSAFLVPALPSLGRLVRAKAEGARLGWGGLWEVARLEAGAGVLLTALFWIAAAAAGLSLLRRRPRSTVYAAAAMGAQWLGVVGVLRPSGLAHAVVANRYVLVTLPVVLLAVSWSLARAWEWSRERRGILGWAGAAAAALFLGLLAFTGPYATDPGLRLGPFAGTTVAVSFVREEPELPGALVPRIYRLLGEEPGDDAVIEVPSHFGSYTQTAAIAFARVHGRPVVLAVENRWVGDPRLALRTVVQETPQALRAADARFLVLHLDRPRLGRLVGDPYGPGGRQPSSSHNRVVVRARELRRKLRRAWGPPHLVDGEALVWDLAQLAPINERSRGSGGAGPPPGRGAAPRPRR